MAKVLGVGGLFFKSRDPDALRKWYGDVLGISFTNWGGVVFESGPVAEHPGSATVWMPFQADTDHFGAADNQFMFNLMVDDLAGVLARCAQHGVLPEKPMIDDAMGRFAHIFDPEGRKVELWEPKPMAAPD